MTKYPAMHGCIIAHQEIFLKIAIAFTSDRQTHPPQKVYGDLESWSLPWEEYKGSDEEVSTYGCIVLHHIMKFFLSVIFCHQPYVIHQRQNLISEEKNNFLPWEEDKVQEEASMQFF